MRKSDTLGGAIDHLEYYENVLETKIKQLKSDKRISLSGFVSLGSAIDRRNLGLRSMKRILRGENRGLNNGSNENSRWCQRYNRVYEIRGYHYGRTDNGIEKCS